MNSWRATALIVLAVAALEAGAQERPSQKPTQTFRTGTEVVLVDVSVRDGAKQVAGLGPDDFVLTDNGVRQRIQSVEQTAVTIDLTLVVDVSGSSHGRIFPRPAIDRVEADVRTEVTRIASTLRPDDRVRVLALDRHVQLITPLTPAGSPLSMKLVDAGGLPALYDSLAVALLYPSEPARRHVVIARIKGEDTISAVDVNVLQQIADRSDALFHLVLMETTLDNEDAVGAFQCQFMGLCWPARQFWVPFRRRLVGAGPMHRLTPDGMVLARAAEDTGGALHKATGLTVPTLASTFERTFEESRSGYLLRYTPQRVTAGGWHEIDVQVPASRRYEVRARRGYAVEEPIVGASPRPLPETPRTLADFISLYEGGAYQRLADGLQVVKDPLGLIREFGEHGNPWPAAPRREAAFAVDLAQPGLFSGDRDTRERARELLERLTRLVRHPLEPDTFERYWHFAVLTLMEGTVRPTEATAFVERALERFPDEPRFLLSRAIVSEQRWAGVGRQGGREELDRPQDVESVLQDYEKGTSFPETAVEARLRMANLLHRLNRHQEAFEQLSRIRSDTGDVYLRYLKALTEGKALAALQRFDEAGAAYRRALEVMPGAQSARVGLMNVLVLRGDRTGAEVLAREIENDRSAALDPWWIYWQGQYRLHSLVMSRIREMSR